MSDPVEILAANLDVIRAQVADAAVRSGRQPGEIKLVAVTKYVDAKVVRALIQGGATDLGESRPQQLRSKADALRDLEQVRWHLVGHLQRNKVRAILPLVDLIHSVDSDRLIVEIDQEAGRLGRQAAVLLEVNISGDAAKHGFSPDELQTALQRFTSFENVRIGGLMAMAHREGGRGIARADFAAMRELRDQLASSAPPEISLEELSLGMSADFEEAILEGATIVRVGRALYEGLELPQR
jgi:hypothetical protein